MSRHEEALNYALQVLSQEQYKAFIYEIYLYGSCARGTQKFDSDIDLLIKIDENIPKDVLRKMRMDVIPDYNLPEVELKFFKEDTFSSSPQFNENLKKEGILLWKRK